jgi:hypothetical protein
VLVPHTVTKLAETKGAGKRDWRDSRPELKNVVMTRPVLAVSSWAPRAFMTGHLPWGGNPGLASWPLEVIGWHPIWGVFTTSADLGDKKKEVRVAAGLLLLEVEEHTEGFRISRKDITEDPVEVGRPFPWLE